MTIDIESWQAIGGAAGLVLVTAHGRWVQYRTKKQADRAVELSAPTGNGFARKVTEALERIEVKQDRTEKLVVDHIAAHANADLTRSSK